MFEFLIHSPPLTQHTLVLVAVIFIKYSISLFSSQIKPQASFAFYRFYCHQLAKKVNKPSNSDTQRKVAGFIAFVITLAPIVLIIWLFEAFIAVPMIWDALLLFIALGSFDVTKTGKEVAQLLRKKKNDEAKALLSPTLLRNSEKMSSMGISKATIEMMLLKTLQQHFAVSCAYLCLGPLASLTFRLVLETHYSWNVKNKNYVKFGAFVNQCVNLLQWLPSRLFTLSLLFSHLGQNKSQQSGISTALLFTANNSLVINLFAHMLNINLGGVAMYHGNEKLRRMSFNEQGEKPNENHTLTAIKKLHLVMIFSLSIIIFLAAIVAILINK